MNFCCQSCNRICEWESREPVTLDGRVHEYKTIANRFCNAESCIVAEAAVNGLPVEKVRAWHPKPLPYATPIDGSPPACLLETEDGLKTAREIVKDETHRAYDDAKAAGSSWHPPKWITKPDVRVREHHLDLETHATKPGVFMSPPFAVGDNLSNVAERMRELHGEVKSFAGILREWYRDLTKHEHRRNRRRRRKRARGW